MAGSLKRRDDSDEMEESHEINVTPFIDVMLVLLIIFMVAAPLSTVDVAVDLPASTAVPQPRPSEPIYVTVKSDLSLALGNEAIGRDALKTALDAKSNGETDERVFVRADKTVDYGDLMEVMNLLRSAGYLKLALVGLESGPPAAMGNAPAAGSASEPTAGAPAASGEGPTVPNSPAGAAR